MASFNLVRNSKVFFTTNVAAATGIINTGATMTTSNTFEIQVLDGFSFSQGTTQSTVQLSEAGNTPVRGQRAFNTALNPVDFSFSTYIRPYNSAGTITAEETVLWNALLSSAAMDSTGVAIVTPTTLSRATTVTNVATLTCAATNLTAGGIALNDFVNVGGCAGANATEWNQAVQVTAITPSATAATSITLTYLNAPATSATTAATTITAVKLYKGAVVPMAANSTFNSAYTLATSATSNKNQLQPFGMYFLVDNLLYAVDNCALESVAIDFSLANIATAVWTGKATALRLLNSGTNVVAVTYATPTSSAVFSNTTGTAVATGTAAAKNTLANYITNKLSTMSLVSGINGTSGTTYSIALTGGNITYANNLTYVTPAILGIVNAPVQYFTGTRSITGNVTAYLKAGTGITGSAQLLSDILTANAAETKFALQIEVGGAANATRVEFDMNGCLLQVPSIATGDPMTTTINFTAQGYDSIISNNIYDLGQTNDIAIRYFSA